MLAIHCGDELAAVEFRRGQNGRRQIRGEERSRLVTQPARFHRQNGSAVNMVDLHLDVTPAPSDEQFGFVAILGG